MGIGPVYAIRSLLKKNNMRLGDIELVEVCVCGVLMACHLVNLHDLLYIYIQWNPSKADTIGNQQFVPGSKVSLTQGLPVYFQ